MREGVWIRRYDFAEATCYDHKSNKKRYRRLVVPRYLTLGEAEYWYSGCGPGSLSMLRNVNLTVEESSALCVQTEHKGGDICLPRLHIATPSPQQKTHCTYHARYCTSVGMY